MPIALSRYAVNGFIAVWDSRHSGSRHTLDVAVSDDPDRDYHARLVEQNMLLRNHFSDVLEDVGVALGDHLDGSVRLDATLAHPGFHIFEGPAIAASFEPSLHFDLQHRALRWPFDVAEEDGLLSFTLAVKLPRLGGGLHYWNLTEPELAQLQYQRGITLDQFGKTTPNFHRYTPGVMAVQMVPVLHRIAPIAERFPRDQRITLQGHAIRDGNTWILCW